MKYSYIDDIVGIKIMDNYTVESDIKNFEDKYDIIHLNNIENLCWNIIVEV